MVRFSRKTVKGNENFMALIKIFEYREFNKKAHSAKAKEELEKMGAENIAYLANGKPVAENMFVSISHSNGKCAVCTSERPVGIDIEKVTDRNFEKTVKKIFGEKEKAYLLNNKSPSAFYEIWTRKEAYSKISGEGIKNIIKGTDTFCLDGYDFKTQFFDGFVMTVCEKREIAK